MGNQAIGRLKQIQTATRNFLSEKDLEADSRARPSRLRRAAHFWLLVVKSFQRNRCPVRASALAYSSLLALVPMMAVAIGVATSLLQNQGQDAVGKMIDQMVVNVAPALGLQNSTDANQATDRRHEFVGQITDSIGRIHSGALGATGMVALLFVAISMLVRIEETFNDIWGITRGRSWVARVVQYWATITLAPILLVVVVGLTSGPQLNAVHRYLDGLPLGAGALVSFLFRFLPFLLLSLAFGLFYQLMPNTRVRWQAALAGGVVAGCLWQLNNQVGVLYVSSVVKNSKIYGSLGIIPVFMVGLYFCWLILLFGAQVAYAFQNREAYLQEKQAEGVNQKGREFVALRLMTQLAHHFRHGEKPPAVEQLSASLGVPTRLVTQLLNALLQAQLVIEVSDRETGYAPARPLDRITAQDVLQALRAGAGSEPATREDDARLLVRSEFDRIGLAESAVASQLTLEALASREPSVESPAPPPTKPASTNPRSSAASTCRTVA